MSTDRPFRIVHLSDLHLTRDDGSARSEPKLFGALRGMNEAFRTIVRSRAVQSANYVIVTGDVTDRGDLASWEVFWEAVRGAGLMDRMAVLPGNHDVCHLGLARLPDRDFRKIDLQRAVAGLKLGCRLTKLPWVVRPDPRVAVFGLNSNNLGNLSVATNALGEVRYYQLKSLASRLYQNRDVPVKIVALHHSPNIPMVETARRRRQRPFGPLERLAFQIPEDQRHGLMLLCVAHRVRLVLHGHLHMREDRRISGVRIVGAPASTEPLRQSGEAKEHGFYVYTVQREGQRVSCRFETVRVG
ncbi:MAG: metallophosphoesterase [Phycisphaerae bacterium]|nr:metallophosphoesterase [Phycisphaerae bacterium]